MTVTYEMAYKEVLEVLKNLDEQDLKKIPIEEIRFLKLHADKTYNYIYNEKLPIEKQNLSKKAKAILVTYFRDYFATENQKRKLEIILKNNDVQNEELKRKEYSNNVFKNNISENKINNEYNSNNQIKENNNNNDNKMIVVHKEKIWNKIISKIRKILEKIRRK